MSTESVKKTGGRRRVEMKKIEAESSRMVTFSKRKAGLFKKAGELCARSGAEVAVVVLSGKGKPYSFGSPSVDAVLSRYLEGTAASGRHEWWELPLEGMGLEELTRHREMLEDLNAKVKAMIQHQHQHHS